MASNAATKLKSLIVKDPRTAVLLLEILGPPPGLTSTKADSTTDQ